MQDPNNLGARLKSEGTGIYYGSKAEHYMGNEGTFFDNLFNSHDQKIIDSFHPRDNISKVSLQSLLLPRELREVLSSPNESAILRHGGILFFMHYSIDKKRAIKKLGSKVDLGKEDLSGIYTNFMGETLYVGPRSLMQRISEELKKGFKRALPIASQVLGDRLAIVETNSFQETHVYDLVSGAKKVVNKRYKD